MNIAWSTVFIVFAFFPPGIAAARRYIFSLKQIPTEIRILGLISITILTAALSHFMGISLIMALNGIFSFQFPLPDLDFFNALVSGNSLFFSQNSINIKDYIFHDWIRIGVYYIFVISIGYILGFFVAKSVSSLTIRPEEAFLLTGESNTWTLVDICTSDNLVYSGFFHSEFEGSISSESFFCISLATKKTFQQPSGKFVDVDISLDFDSLNKRIITYAKSIKKAELEDYLEQNQQLTPSIAILQFITWKEPPQFIIPKSAIKNLTLRHIVIGQDTYV